jgi:hypothetical protein
MTADIADAVVVESVAGFVPYANDVPLMAGLGVRFAHVHEVFARGGYMPAGDDVRLGFGVFGYRAVLAPGRFVRPVFGGYVAGLPDSCVHDERGNPRCTPTNLWILSASGGVRLEPTRWLGIAAALSLGVDSYPNPFGMIELGLVFALPLS